jgi:ATP-dependent RNA helicase SUPV3L1/SUV3
MLWPPWRIFEKFSQEFPGGTPLATMVSQFADLGATTGHYRVLESETQIILAQAIEDISGIDLESRYSITLAPVATRNQDEVDLFVRLATVLARAKPVTIESPALQIPLWFVDKVPGDLKVGNGKWTAVKLHTLEMIHKLIMIYCWLSYLV